MESEVLKLLAPYGVGGILAYILFMFYRQDRQKSEEKLTELGKDFKQTVEANTAAMTKLCVLVEQIAEDHSSQPIRTVMRKASAGGGD